jgi:uncharacterized membrane protein YphA (DoxX/SURF4 family)
MNSFIIPVGVVYAGLAGTLLALLVATAMNRWSPKVFFLLALRLAIGWHFLFEGLYKIQSHETGPSESNRQFSSEPYFRVAPGPIGAYMRQQFDDPAAVIAEKIKLTKEIAPEMFAKLPIAEQAAACPAAVAQQIDGLESTAAAFIKSEAEKQLANIEVDEAKAMTAIAMAEEKAMKEAKTDEEKVKAKVKAEDERKKAKEQAETTRQSARKKNESVESATRTLTATAKAAYARWVYGAEGRNTKVKFITGDVMLTAPERLAHIEWLRSEVKAAEGKQEAALGNGYSIDSKRAAELRMELNTAETDLAKDANAFVDELKKELNGGKTVEESTALFKLTSRAFAALNATVPDRVLPKLEPLKNKELSRDDFKKEIATLLNEDEKKEYEEIILKNAKVLPSTPGQRMDKVTMWFLVCVGTCLMAGLFTRLSCLLAAGFLVVTYLAHPAFPWYPLPPNTEGNPVFINKNVIECLALLALACMPTGRWLGLDALVLRPFCRYKGECCASTPPAVAPTHDRATY